MKRCLIARILLYVLALAVVLVSCTQPSDSTPLPQTGAIVTTLAGKVHVSGSDDGTGANARFNIPWGTTTDGTNLYVADSENNKIRQIVISTGEVSTLAGSGSPGSADGTGTAAEFWIPRGITIDSTHANLYVADTENHTIRQIVISTRAVTTLAGTTGTSGSSDSSNPPARFYYPSGITTDGSYLYVSDTWNNTIRGMNKGGLVGTVAGTAGSQGSDDGTGSAARFYWPNGITSDGTNLYVADSYNHRIRKIVISTAEVTTLAGLFLGSSDGRGSGAGFNTPNGITTDGTSLYVADSLNHTIRVVTE